MAAKIELPFASFSSLISGAALSGFALIFAEAKQMCVGYLYQSINR
jgi:hypothetical protein